MANTLQGKRIAILAADGVERVELGTPRKAVQGAGAETDLLSLQSGEVQARNNDLEPAGTFSVDGLVAHASVDDYDALSPDDLPAFCNAIVDAFAQSPAGARGR